ncbi:MAG: hypothetical protein V2B18_22700 [Pseudomonadota bacterium]
MILDYQVNTLTTVEQSGDGLWRVDTRLDDTLLGLNLLLEVKTPALDIRRAEVVIRRDILGIMPDLSGVVQNLVGVRVGPGMTKIVRSILGGDSGSDRLAELVLEAMEMLINAFTVPELVKTTAEGGVPCNWAGDGPTVRLNDVVIGLSAAARMAQNPRLKDSCVAFKNL